ncbi:MAG: hypothetical protein DIU60_004230, partial [Actinomycetes bacterium]
MTVAEEPVPEGAGHGAAAGAGQQPAADSAPTAAVHGPPAVPAEPSRPGDQRAVAADAGLLRQALAEVRRVIVGQEH